MCVEGHGAAPTAFGGGGGGVMGGGWGTARRPGARGVRWGRGRGPHRVAPLAPPPPPSPGPSVRRGPHGAGPYAGDRLTGGLPCPPPPPPPPSSWGRSEGPLGGGGACPEPVPRVCGPAAAAGEGGGVCVSCRPQAAAVFRRVFCAGRTAALGRGGPRGPARARALCRAPPGPSAPPQMFTPEAAEAVFQAKTIGAGVRRLCGLTPPPPPPHPPCPPPLPSPPLLRRALRHDGARPPQAPDAVRELQQRLPLRLRSAPAVGRGPAAGPEEGLSPAPAPPMHLKSKGLRGGNIHLRALAGVAPN